MSEYDFPEGQREARDEAREKTIEAAQAWWDSYAVDDPDYEGAVVTGYVLIAEAVLRSGYPSIAWCSGNGQPPGTNGLTGLVPHRVDGMCRHVIREVYKDVAISE